MKKEEGRMEVVEEGIEAGEGGGGTGRMKRAEETWGWQREGLKESVPED